MASMRERRAAVAAGAPIRLRAKLDRTPAPDLSRDAPRADRAAAIAERLAERTGRSLEAMTLHTRHFREHAFETDDGELDLAAVDRYAQGIFGTRAHRPHAGALGERRDAVREQLTRKGIR
jgi:hypothetical protein